MKYEKIFESSILDEMFYSRSDGFETEIIKIKKISKEDTGLYKQAEIEESLTALIKKLVTDDNIKKQILNLLRKYSNAYFNDLDYWIKQYYELGFCDGLHLKDETKLLEEDYDGKVNG